MNRPLVIAAALLALSGCDKGADNTIAPANVAAVAPPVGTDWVSTVSATPDGGFRMGNPNAPIKLVEYGSLTCPHCAAFSGEAAEALKTRYIPSGKVSYEFRSYLLHGQDLMATMLIQCGGAQPFFSLLEAAYASQQDWLGKLIALPQGEQARLQSLPVAAQNAALAQASGLDQFVIQRGVPGDAVKQCLADTKTPDRLLQVRNDANTKFNLSGTPTFIVNGQVVEGVSGWKDLEPQLKAAGA